MLMRAQEDNADASKSMEPGNKLERYYGVWLDGEQDDDSDDMSDFVFGPIKR